MIDKGRTIISFYEMLRRLFDPDPNKFIFVYLKDGRRLKIIFKIEEEIKLSLVKNG